VEETVEKIIVNVRAVKTANCNAADTASEQIDSGED
jgi:hypothetical protein